MTKITILIPCYNELGTLEEIVNKVLKSKILEKEIIIIDDCSYDGTREILESKISKLVNKVIYHKKNFGKGAAIRSGIKHAGGDIIIIQDADLEYDPNDYEKLIEPIIKNQADVVYGSRFIESKDEKRRSFFWAPQDKRKLYFSHRVANYLLTLLSNMFSNVNLTDMETGYKCFKKKVVENINLQENGFGFEPEITAKLAKKKIRFLEVGISYNGRTYDEGKKIRAIDGLKAVYYIFKYNIFG